ALENNLFILSSQSVLLEDTELHREVFTSMLDKQKHVQKCGFFMPMVISLNFAIKLDKYVLEKAVDYLKTNKKIVLAVNITNEFMKDRSSFIWFRQFLISSKSYNKRLIFEISDNTVVQHTEICNDFVGLVKGLGYSFGVDNFILDNDSLSYLKKLKPEYIKINQDYLLDKSEDKKTDTAIKSLITVTDSLDILLIVTKIETEEQIAIFKSKNIQYFQGLAVADIVPMETDNG
ncbi:MAG: EAL domain-containing protein, partial [Desulfobacteraceae bacterium]|nr:EAL domain-containing protein [Desulfobacteraceae bacterium]